MSRIVEYSGLVAILTGWMSCVLEHSQQHAVPHIFFVFVSVPRPPRNLTIEKVTSNSVLVHWEPPLDSLYSEYSIR
jgi:hypothetical protein